MNVLFALYGDFSSNSSIPLALHAQELHRLGHHCAVAVPSGLEMPEARGNPALRALLYAEALAAPDAIFPDGRGADIVHAWTPREGVREFVTAYLALRPAPFVIYLEDNEGWIARTALAQVGLHEEVLLQHTQEVIAAWTPAGLPNPLRYCDFIGLADAAVVIQDKLEVDVPPWVPCTTVMPGTDLERFAPRAPDPALRRRYGVGEGERVIVYPGGLNDFTRPGLMALCRAVGLINRQGTPCRLLRSGPVPLDFLGELPEGDAAMVSDLGVLPRADMPGLLALADVFVQPGEPNAFEDLRLPGKLPELLASGRPVVLPDTNIAHLLRDGVNAMLHRTGSAEEIAGKCLGLFADPERARAIGAAGRRFAEAHFEPKAQAARLERVYHDAREGFDPRAAAKLWNAEAPRTPVHELLALRLRLLADSPRADAVAAAQLLRSHARHVEFSHQRAAGLETGIAVRDREIATLKEEHRQRVDALERALAERTAERDAANAALAAANVQLAATRQGLEEARRSLAHTAGALAQRERHIAAIESSLSWRLSRPLRAAGPLLSRWLARLRSRP